MPKKNQANWEDIEPEDIESQLKQRTRRIGPQMRRRPVNSFRPRPKIFSGSGKRCISCGQDYPAYEDECPTCGSIEYKVRGDHRDPEGSQIKKTLKKDTDRGQGQNLDSDSET